MPETEQRGLMAVRAKFGADVERWILDLPVKVRAFWRHYLLPENPDMLEVEVRKADSIAHQAAEDPEFALGLAEQMIRHRREEAAMMAGVRERFFLAKGFARPNDPNELDRISRIDAQRERLEEQVPQQVALDEQPLEVDEAEVARRRAAAAAAMGGTDGS